MTTTTWKCPPPTNPIAMAAIATGALTGTHSMFDDPIGECRWVVKEGTVRSFARSSCVSWAPNLLRTNLDSNKVQQISFDPAAA